MSKIGLIISREYITRVRKKSFILMSFLGPLLIVGFVLYAGYQFLDKPDFSLIKFIFGTPKCDNLSIN